MLRPKRKVVVSVHGIESHGIWEMELAPLISEQGWMYYPLHYGIFRAYQFLLPFERNKKVEWFRETYNKEIRNRCRDVWPSVIAHSFGTYIVTKALETYDGIKLDKLVLCGSIVRQDFDWEKLFRRKQLTKVRNDYGRKDFWAGISQFAAPGTGPSGREGFAKKHERLLDEEFEEYGHGSVFGYDHYEKHWIPFLKEGVPYEGETQAPKEYEEAVSPMDAARWSAITYFHQFVRPVVEAMVTDKVFAPAQSEPLHVKELVVLIPKSPGGAARVSVRQLYKELATSEATAGELDRKRPVQFFNKTLLVDVPTTLNSLSFLDKREDSELVEAVAEFKQTLADLLSSPKWECEGKVRIATVQEFLANSL